MLPPDPGMQLVTLPAEAVNEIAHLPRVNQTHEFSSGLFPEMDEILCLARGRLITYSAACAQRMKLSSFWPERFLPRPLLASSLRMPPGSGCGISCEKKKKKG